MVNKTINKLLETEFPKLYYFRCMFSFSIRTGSVRLDNFVHKVDEFCSTDDVEHFF